MLVTECVCRKSLCHRVKMCKVQMLRALVKQRLTAAAEEIFGLFERTIAEYEEELSRSKEENERQRKLLDAVFSPQLRLHRADVQQLLVVKEEVPPEQQDQEEPEPPHIKEEQEELCTSQEGEQLQGLEEADITAVPVKSEDDEEKAQSSQLHHRLTEQMETEADGEDCGGPEPARNSHTHTHLQPDTDEEAGDSSEPETDDSDGWKETREPDEVPVSDSRCRADEKPFSCCECGKRFGFEAYLKRHVRTHTGEKPFSCSTCGKSFPRKDSLDQHTRIHSGEKPFGCSVCGQRFSWRHQLRIHKCAGRQSSQLHLSETEENREAEPPASSSAEQMETEADGEDCGGPEPARNSHTHTHLQPDTDEEAGDSSDPETDDSADWKETSEPQSGSNSVKNDEAPVSDSRCSAGEKPFSCSECGKRFCTNIHLKIHMVTHSTEKPFSCLVCGKRFTRKDNLNQHMRIHTGEKRFNCSVCEQRFTWLFQLRNHQCAGRQSSQLHHRLTEQMETEADGEDCGGPEPARNSHPHTHLQPDTDEEAGDSSETEVSDGNWEETREVQSGLNSVKNDELPVSDSRCSAGEKPFSCPECEKRFVSKPRLKEHLRCHTGEKPYSCSVCNKSFTQSGNLQRHMRIHTREKPFSCSVCDQTFSQKSHLKKHVITHAGGTPISCSVCGKSFLHQVNLTNHMVVHTGEKRYHCSVCNKRFGWRRQVKRHKCAGRQSSKLHQSQTEENREAEPPASSSAEQIKTEADVEDRPLILCVNPTGLDPNHTQHVPALESGWVYKCLKRL